MSQNLKMMRELLLKAETSDPFEIWPNLPVVQMDSLGIPTGFLVPKNEGLEFETWRYLFEQGFVVAETDGRAGIRRGKTKIMRLTSKGRDFLELCRSENDWNQALKVCADANLNTLAALRTVLNRSARERLSRALKGEK